MILRIGLCVCLLAAVGCESGPKVSPVSGKVTLDGKPLANAAVSFKGSSTAAMGTTDANGVYKLTDAKSTNIGGGAVAGDYKVGILWYKPDAKDTSRSSGDAGETTEGATTEDKSAATAQQGPQSALPAAYQNPDTSGLTATVKAGENTFDFALDSKFKGAGK